MSLIIVEGPDGAGKTSLIKQLRQQLPHYTWLMSSNSKPASSEQIGEVTRWINRVPEDVTLITDRHPIISEYVYGTIIRGFCKHSLTFREMTVETTFIVPTLIVHCNLPIEDLRDNLTKTQQMAGVSNHIGQIYDTYQTLFTKMEECGARIIPYNYKKTESIEITHYIMDFIEESVL